MATRRSTNRWVLDASGMVDVHDAPLRKQRIDELRRLEDAKVQSGIENDPDDGSEQDRKRRR